VEETSESGKARRRLSSCYQPSNTSDRCGGQCGNITVMAMIREKGVEERRGEKKDR